jgi:aminoglycoside phosphotransferase (APT) family kinase protein
VSGWTPRSLPSAVWPAATEVAEVARALDAELGFEATTCVPVRPPRAEARSTVYFLGTADRPGQCRWVVKQPRTSWSQDDLTTPVAAEREFAQLSRLAAYFAEIGGPARVPTPVAALPGLGAFAMEYVPGAAVSDLLTSRSLLRPEAFLDGVGRSADFLRRLHDLELLPSRSSDLAREAQEALELMERRLRPAGLPVPRAVTRVLAGAPARTVVMRQVRLHGDFTPANFLLPDERTIVGIDVDLQRIGVPEDDLARFISFSSAAMPFIADTILPTFLRRHRSLAVRLVQGYGVEVSVPLLEIRLLRHLSVRWLRLRQLARLHGRAALLRPRLRSIGAQVRVLMVESAHRLRAAT